MPTVISKQIPLRIAELKILVKIITLNDMWEALSEGQWGKALVGRRGRGL